MAIGVKKPIINEYDLDANISNPNVLYVNKNRTDVYVEDGTIACPYKTIMGAVNKIISNGDNTWLNPYIIKITAAIYTENIVLENLALYRIALEGDSFRDTIIQPASGNALQSTANNKNLAWLTIRKMWFIGGVDLTGDTSAADGGWMGYNLFFENIYFTSGNLLFKNLAYPTFWGNTRFGGSGTLKFSNVTQVTMNPYVEIGTGVTSFTIETDQTALVKTPKDWTTGTRIILMGCSSSKDLTWSLINITTWTGTALQMRYARFGSSGHTIPVNASLLVYNATLVGNYTNNGTLSMYGGNITGTLTNNATLNLYQKTNVISNDSSITGTTLKDALNTIYGIIDNGSKVKFTTEGGLAVKLTNKTGGASVKGYCVTNDTTTNNAVKLVPIDSPNCLGVIYENGIADGQEVWVVISGIADVYFWDSTTRGHFARTGLSSDTGEVAGQAISEIVPTSPFATDKHFCEIGHVLETRTGAGLAKTILHFN